eukprot:1358091-Amorphochlora_amoeboformis.AAC.1
MYDMKASWGGGWRDNEGGTDESFSRNFPANLDTTGLGSRLFHLRDEWQCHKRTIRDVTISKISNY